MNIWIINHYAVPPKYYANSRSSAYAKYLTKMGHSVTIFASSTVHNSDLNLITDGSLSKEDIVDGIKYVYVRNRGYSSNGADRIINMFLFPHRLSRVCKKYPKPDAILAVSVTPMACMKGIKLSKKYGCRGVAEIADLWPESLIAYNFISKKNPLARILYRYEKKLYTKADAVTFTMEGGKDYIIQQGWDKEHGGPIELSKIHHINNGVDLEVFDSLAKENSFSDPHLDDPSLFKVVYTGAIRRANRIQELVEVAKHLKSKGRSNIKLLIWGAGDKVEDIQKSIEENGLDNIILKGTVPKNSIPSLLSKSNLNVYMLADSPLFKYGLSLNKSFEYFASGKPVLASNNSGYSLIDRYRCGKCLESFSAEAMAEEIIRFSELSAEETELYCKNARRVAESYDSKLLTEKLYAILSEQSK